MSAWGVALFSDDTACDVRDAYRELIEDGVEDEEAVRRVLDGFGDALVDPDEGPVVWLALAWTQSKVGRLDATVRDRALGVIERGEGLERWQEEGSRLWPAGRPRSTRCGPSSPVLSRSASACVVRGGTSPI
ncbi:hypothetical protein CA984_09605 [Streptosporangium minutum]|uniref:DUF4259 domain-containing protein n=1 Tax=Streptosporangium minutum TaxID=569862 RepID=A0A243RRZ1_9ACTN|nr:hypothetical protein CA984_09605 [Streptosporangium minutum]